MELAAATWLTEYHHGRYRETADVSGFETQASRDAVARDMRPSIFSFLQIKELYIKTAQMSADVAVINDAKGATLIVIVSFQIQCADEQSKTTLNDLNCGCLIRLE